jgi:hypothetical protein
MQDASAEGMVQALSQPEAAELSDPLTSTISSKWTVALLALALGIAADVLFYRQKLGVNTLLFTGLALGALVVAYRRETTVAWIRRNLWLMAPTLFFAAMMFLRDEPGLAFMNAVATLLLLCVLYTTLGTNPVERLTVMAYPKILMMLGAFSMVSGWSIASFAITGVASRRDRTRVFWRIVLGLVIAGPFLLIFIVLFSSADAVFASGVRGILRPDVLKNLPNLFLQAIWIGGAAWLAAGALAFGLERATHVERSHDLEEPISPPGRIGFIESATVLTAVNALFMVFVSIQFTYLFGGRANVEVSGFTYADYARRGFFELVAVAVLTMGLLLALDWLARREGPRQVLAISSLCYLLVAMVLVILVSAFQRMSLYESVYGFTSLRVYTHWFMVWIGVVFMLKALSIWLKRGQIFAFGGFLSLIISLAGFNLLNPDAFIAQQNMQRYVATGSFGSGQDTPTRGRRSPELDTDLITSLSYDATPVIASYLPQLKGAELDRIVSVLRTKRVTLERDLESRSWQSFHLARARGLSALAEHQELTDTQPGQRTEQGTGEPVIR